MTERQIDLTLKWLAGEVSNADAAKALHIKSAKNVYWKMASNMRELHRLGRIKRVKPLRVRGVIN